MDTTREECHVVIAIVDGDAAKLNLVGYQYDCITAQLVGGVEGRDCSLTINNEQSRKIDIIECAGEASAAIGMSRNVAEEGLGEIVHEVDVGTMSIDGEVDGVMDGRYIAVYVCMCLSSVVGNCLDINLPGFMIPLSMSMENSHASTLELEVADIEISRGSKLSEDR